MYKSPIQGLLSIRHFSTATIFMPTFWNEARPASRQYLTLDGGTSKNRSCQSLECLDRVNSGAYKDFNDVLYYLHPVACFLCEAGLP